MVKKVLFVVYQSPCGTIWINETFRTAFGMYGEDIEPAVLFIGQAVIGLSCQTAPEKLGLLPIKMVQKYLDKYETEVYAIKDDMLKYKVCGCEEGYKAKIIERNDVKKFIKNYDFVIFM